MKKHYYSNKQIQRKCNWKNHSKSYKKYPIVKQEKVDKTLWNHKIRNLKIEKIFEENWEDESLFSLKGKQYQKIFPNWNTWQYIWTLEDAIENYHPNNYFPTLESWIEYWKKCCFRK